MLPPKFISRCSQNYSFVPKFTYFCSRILFQAAHDVNLILLPKFFLFFPQIFVKFPNEAMQISIGQNLKRGRPETTTLALELQPSKQISFISDECSTELTSKLFKKIISTE